SNAGWIKSRARKQAADSPVRRLLTRAVLYRRPDVACPDLVRWEQRQADGRRLRSSARRLFCAVFHCRGRLDRLAGVRLSRDLIFEIEAPRQFAALRLDGEE